MFVTLIHLRICRTPTAQRHRAKMKTWCYAISVVWTKRRIPPTRKDPSPLQSPVGRHPICTDSDWTSPIFPPPFPRGMSPPGGTIPPPFPSSTRPAPCRAPLLSLRPNCPIRAWRNSPSMRTEGFVLMSVSSGSYGTWRKALPTRQSRRHRSLCTSDSLVLRRRSSTSQGQKRRESCIRCSFFLWVFVVYFFITAFLMGIFWRECFEGLFWWRIKALPTSQPNPLCFNNQNQMCLGRSRLRECDNSPGRENILRNREIFNPMTDGR